MKAKAMRLGEAPPDVEGLVQCSGDVDEFTALAWNFLRTHHVDGRYDAPIALASPEFRWYRWVPTPGGEFDRVLHDATGPGRGAWLGAEIRVVQIGCSECQQLRGRHAEGCLNANIVNLITLQFGRDKSGPLSNEWVHAVRVRGRVPGVSLAGTPGPTLCGFPRFGPGSTGWSLGGGSVIFSATYRGCYLCGKKARSEFPGVAITGTKVFAEAFAATTGVPLASHLGRYTSGRTAELEVVGCL